MATFVLILDRSLAAARILYDVLHDVVEYETISVDKKDVHKNTALAWMRLHGVVVDDDVIKLLRLSERNLCTSMALPSEALLVDTPLNGAGKRTEGNSGACCFLNHGYGISWNDK